MGKGIEVVALSGHFLSSSLGLTNMSTCPGTDTTSTDRSNEKRLLTIWEFSVRYGRSRSRTYELIRAGVLPAVKDGRSTLIPVDGAEAWARDITSSRADRSAIGASRPLPRIAATVCFLITERALSLSGRNWSSCPFPDLVAGWRTGP